MNISIQARTAYFIRKIIWNPLCLCCEILLIHLIFWEGIWYSWKKQGTTFFSCVKMKQEAWDYHYGNDIYMVFPSFTNESTLCSRKYIFSSQNAVPRKQDGFKWTLNLCVLWSREYLSIIVFTGLITPTLMWARNYLTSNLWNDFLMVCSMKRFGLLLFSSCK